MVILTVQFIYFDKALEYINGNSHKFKNRADMLEMARGVIYGNKAEALIIKSAIRQGKGVA